MSAGVSVRYTDNQGRQYEFNMDAEDNVSVRVYHGLQDINTISQNNIFVEKKTSGLSQDRAVSMAGMRPDMRKTILQSFQNALREGNIADNEFQVENGGASEVKKRNTDTTLHKVSTITLVL